MTNYIFIILREQKKNKNKNKAVIYKEYASVA